MYNDAEKISDDLVSDVIDQMMNDKSDAVNPLSRQKRNIVHNPWSHNVTGVDIGEVSIQMSSFDSTLNVTLDARYVADEEKEGNLSYYVPFSEYMPLMPVILKFNEPFFPLSSLEADLNVEYCPMKFLPVGSLCPVLENIFKMTNATFTVRKQTNSATSWQLPIGFFQLSAYKFRIGTGKNMQKLYVFSRKSCFFCFGTCRCLHILKADTKMMFNVTKYAVNEMQEKLKTLILDEY
uniref:Myelin gene regulatory factor C-terminal domain-containing protein n=1 Tax=Romanomermis culicivorax TaxID=13658 RepID=A0A915JR91_ROMCU